MSFELPSINSLCGVLRKAHKFRAEYCYYRLGSSPPDLPEAQTARDTPSPS